MYVSGADGLGGVGGYGDPLLSSAQAQVSLIIQDYFAKSDERIQAETRISQQAKQELALTDLARLRNKIKELPPTVSQSRALQLINNAERRIMASSPDLA